MTGLICGLFSNETEWRDLLVEVDEEYNDDDDDDEEEEVVDGDGEEGVECRRCWYE